MAYLVCENCGEYYKLEEGESPDEYSDTCKCGGKLDYYEYIPLTKIYKKCSRCGFEGEMDYAMKTLSCRCPNCFNNLLEVDTCPVCSFKGKMTGKVPFKLFIRAINTCPSCGNSFGITQKDIEQKKDTSYYSSIIRGILWLIIMLIFAILIIKDMFFK